MALEAMLLVLQILVNVDCLRTFVAAATAAVPTEFDAVNSSDSQDLFNLLAPPSYVLCVWMQLFLCFTFGVWLGPKSTVGSFIARYSTPASREPLFLSLALGVTSISAILWDSLMLLERRFLAPIALFFVWCGSLPFYLVLDRPHRAPNTLLDVIIFTLGELSVRLYFTWLTGAVVFGVLDTVQYLHGDYFSYTVYVQLLGAMLALAFGAYIQCRDPVVALMATWFLVGLANGKGTYEGDAKETFEKLQTAATVIKPVFLLVLIIDAVRSLRHFLQNFERHSEGSRGDPNFNTMEGTWFALINAALFVMQAVVNIVYAKRVVTVAREYETLITPASYALVLWILVYALEAVLVVVDVFVPRYSMFADANQPAQLRLCFGITCILNTIWVFLYMSGHVYASTVVIYALWLAILVLYIYAVNDRNAREIGPFDWILYLCNELPISMYFAWVTTVAFTQLAMSMQHSNHDYLGLTTYVSYLCVVIVLGLLASRYAQDLVVGLVIVWYLIAVSIKHVQFPHSVQCMDIAVRACAGEGAAIIAAVLAIELCQSFMEDSRPPASGMGSGMAVVAGATYGSTSA
ncbi:hypothetical protein PC116_g4605 [Phytophthora cactorum]|uniref:Uncharacterized protein n=1 Tax=Phytophthora cactorum TaxID=29920 RepID=A0A8T1LI79_9STRA|nr:hypothetical protein PC118_g604 [Phytophthora cactorum]KAG4247609.1 hypothetical protein PC116_g4605 [Phytophthora cactorum]